MPTKSSTTQHTEEIRARMQAIRSDLPGSMEDAREAVSNLTDWSYYVQSYPAIVLPIVAAAAFAIVPQPKQSTPSHFALLGDKEGVRRVRLEQEEVPKKSLISGLVSALLAMAVRSGGTIATRQISQMMMGQNQSRNGNARTV